MALYVMKHAPLKEALKEAGWRWVLAGFLESIGSTA